MRGSLPDLGILDWMMPGLDGAATAAVRVIVYTASNDPGVEHEEVSPTVEKLAL
jgi:hypothetical protein